MTNPARPHDPSCRLSPSMETEPGRSLPVITVLYAVLAVSKDALQSTIIMIITVHLLLVDRMLSGVYICIQGGVHPVQLPTPHTNMPNCLYRTHSDISIYSMLLRNTRSIIVQVGKIPQDQGQRNIPLLCPLDGLSSPCITFIAVSDGRFLVAARWFIRTISSANSPSFGLSQMY